MFGLEGSGFIIAVGLTFLLAGLIVYYVNAKIISLEKAVMQQNSVLGNFINGVKQEMNMNGGPPRVDVKAAIPEGGGDVDSGVGDASVATLEALEAAKNFVNDPRNRIDVSDDSESESDSDSESDEEENNEKVLSSAVPNEIEIVINDIQDKIPLKQNDEIKIIELTNDDDAQSTSSSEGSSEYTIEEIEVEEVVEPGVDNLDIKDILKEIVPINFKTLKVTELRKIVSEKKLKTATVAKGLKKDELIELLTNQ